MAEVAFPTPQLSSQRIFWRQVRVLTSANLRARYRKTVSGFLWVVLNPIILFGTQALVFKSFLKLDVDHYFLFLLSGLLPWVFVNQSCEMCTSLFEQSSRLLKSYPVHPLVFLLAQLLDNFINFMAAFVLLLVPVWIWDPTRTLGLVLLPLAMTTMILGSFGMAWLLAMCQVFLRDTRFVLTFFFSVSYFLTPIFYPVSFVPPGMRWMIEINPFYHLIDPFRAAIYQPTPSGFVLSLLRAAAVAGLFIGAAYLFWRKKRNVMYLYL